MRALAAAFLIAFFTMLAIFGMGSWSCSLQEIPPGGTPPPGVFYKKDCASPTGTFAIGLRESGTFIHVHREETVAIGVVTIAIFTIILGVFTMRLASATRVGAAAALLNARAVLEAERARLHVVIERENIGNWKSTADDWSDPASDGQRIADLEIAYSFRNYGRTPALIHEIGHKVVISPTLPKERDYSVLAPLPIEPAIGAAVRSTPITDVGIPDVTVGTAKAIRDSQATLWFYGYVVYDDTFGWRRMFYFEFHYNGTSNGFRLSFCR